MKKLYLLISAAAVIAAAASCSKTDIQQPETAQSVKINVSVGDFSPETKALKSGWENGDVINVYLDDVLAHTPDFTLTYDGAKWVASELGSDAVSRLKTSGTLKGFWESSNSAVSTWNKRQSGSTYYFLDFPNKSNAATTGVQTPVVAHFYSIPYTYSAGTLTANLDTWYFTTDFQLVVTGLPTGTYSLYTGSNMLTACTAISIGATRAEVSMYGSSSSSYRIGGIANADGVAFVGKVARPNVLMDYVFYLTDHASGKTYSYTKNVSLPTTSGKVLLGAKVPFSSFTLVTP